MSVSTCTVSAGKIAVFLRLGGAGEGPWTSLATLAAAFVVLHHGHQELLCFRFGQLHRAVIASIVVEALEGREEHFDRFFLRDLLVLGLQVLDLVLHEVGVLALLFVVA